MEIETLLALMISIPLTLAYAYLLLKNLMPFVKQHHRISGLKEQGNIVITEAEIIQIEPRELGGRLKGMCTVYVTRVTYTTEKAARGLEHAELIFAKKPSEKIGQKIQILYNREEPSFPMTVDSREANGAALLITKIVLSVAIAFALIYAVMYVMGKYGLDD